MARGRRTEGKVPATLDHATRAAKGVVQRALGKDVTLEVEAYGEEIVATIKQGKAQIAEVESTDGMIAIMRALFIAGTTAKKVEEVKAA